MVWQVMLIVCLGCACVFWIARREHKAAIAQRQGLLDNAKQVLSNADFSFAADGHPIVTGRMEDGTPVKLEMIADTLVTRRLPQLWLRVTLFRDLEALPSFGIISRPTGAEFYSVVHQLANWIVPPSSATPILMRGAAGAQHVRWEPLRQALVDCAANPRVKEIAVGAGFVRLVIQAAEGEASSHLLLRQARFSVQAMPEPQLQDALNIAVGIGDLAANSLLREAA